MFACSVMLFVSIINICRLLCLFFFFFNDTATTEIYTLSLQRRSSDLIPVFPHGKLLGAGRHDRRRRQEVRAEGQVAAGADRDRKSTRLNSSHQIISYAVFCLKKKK